MCAGWRSAPLPVRTKTLLMGHFPIRLGDDLRPGGPDVPVAGITGSDRLPAGIPGRLTCGICAGCEEAGGRIRLGRQQKMLICRDFMGATGLEPATSGVTGHCRTRDMNDVGLQIAVFMRVQGFFACRLRVVCQAISDVCCPFAARARAGTTTTAGLTAALFTSRCIPAPAPSTRECYDGDRERGCHE
jgi:hypothetical protein